MPKVNPINKLLDISAYKGSRTTKLQLVDNSTKSELSEPIEIPSPIMVRLFFLGKAYNLSALKRLDPESRDTLGCVSWKLICPELEFLNEVLSDPVVQYYLADLVLMLESNRTNKNGILKVTPPAMKAPYSYGY